MLSQYCGVCGERQYSIPELAAMYGVSEECIRNLLSSSIASLHIRSWNDYIHID